ncbi:MAG: hypothetical protein U1E27_00470, partial [Kiritimatiellia bacterium]|nr:hypothetical protein [Kiritimatiellia bacterium]
MMKMRILRLSFGFLSSVAMTTATFAQTYTWEHTTGNQNWTQIGVPGWNTNSYPNAVDAVANISSFTVNALNVDGVFTVGTLVRDLFGTTAVWNNVRTANPDHRLVFEVSSGTALLDWGTREAGQWVYWEANMEFKSDTVIRAVSTTNSAISARLAGVLSGSGTLFVDATGAIAGSDLRLTLTNSLNSFSGGVVLRPLTSLWLQNSGSGGTGAIDLNTRYVAFETSTYQTHSNNFSVTNSGGTHFQMRLPNQVIDLTGQISYLGSSTTAGARFGGSSTSTNVSFILSGDNKSTMGVGIFQTEPYSYTSAIVVNHLQALPTNGVWLRGDAGGTSKLLYNIAGTFNERIYAQGGFSSENRPYTVLVGTTDTNTGLTVLDSASAIDFQRAENGLILYAGHADGTLEVKSALTDGTESRNLVKSGPGTVIISRETGNAYDGTTTVSTGTLLVNGSLGGAGAVTVANGATLGGSGVIGGNTTVNGTLAPGTSPGELTFEGNLTLGSGSTSVFEINGKSGGLY